jgi:hypothetical protein
VTRVRGRRGGCARRGAVTSICGSTVVPFSEGAGVCDRAVPPGLQSISEAAPQATHTGLVNTDIVPIPIRPPPYSSSTNVESACRHMRRTDFD